MVGAHEGDRRVTVLGVDPGARRVGLALADAETRFATPLSTVTVTSTDAALRAVADAAREHGAELVVVGHARHLDGRAGEKAREAEAFAERLRASGLRVELWDERMSTAEAHRILRTGGQNRRERTRRVDAVAAQRILQSFLDARARPS